MPGEWYPPIFRDPPGLRKRYCVDLFAGCGGLSLGLEAAGFRPLLFSDVSGSARDTYTHNRDHLIDKTELSLETNKDITKLKPKHWKKYLDGWKESEEWKKAGVEELDLVCGGPPCQGYSGIGHRRRFKRDKYEIPSNHLFDHMIKAIRSLKPKMFLFENVRGLLNSHWTDPENGKVKVFEEVVKAFGKLSGYVIKWKLVHASDYGVPQNRPRVLLVGIQEQLLAQDIRNDSAKEQTAVKEGFLPRELEEDPPSLGDLLSDLIDKKYRRREDGVWKVFPTEEYPVKKAKNPFQESLRRAKEGAGEVEKLTGQEYSNHSQPILKKFKWMQNNPGKNPGKKQFPSKKFSQRLLLEEWG